MPFVNVQVEERIEHVSDKKKDEEGNRSSYGFLKKKMYHNECAQLVCGH